MSRLGAPGAVLPLLTESQTEVPSLQIFYNLYESLKKYCCFIIGDIDFASYSFVCRTTMPQINSAMTWAHGMIAVL
jgi:hypothetical protein